MAEKNKLLKLKHLVNKYFIIINADVSKDYSPLTSLNIQGIEIKKVI